MMRTSFYSFLTTLAAIFFLFPVIIIAGSESSTISGSVVDKVNAQPLHGANVMIEELGIGTTTNNAGAYRLSDVQAGKYTLSTSMIGYAVLKLTIVVPGDTSIDFALSQTVIPGQEIIVTGDRARRRESPIAFSDVTREEIEERWSVQDVPMLLNSLPGVYSYSDAGNGIGYTQLKLRGFDQRRLSVTINGVPLNDPEDHNVYWVDIPNLLSNVEDIQIQRGIGTSLYGRNAFGGSVNLVTTNFPAHRRFGFELGIGSYDTEKYSFDFLSGLIDNTYSFYGRFSRITTDGYRDDAWSELWSYFLSAVRYDQHTTTKINIYGGPERSHAAWDASPESALNQDHRHNPYSHYQNETDNFNQPHYEFHHELRLGENTVLTNTLFYIRGEGYYEQLKDARKLEEYGIEEFKILDPGLFGADSLEYYSGIDLDGDWENDILERDNGYFTLKRTDLVRQKWVLKNQYGWVPTLRWNFARSTITLGGEISTFDSEHFGKVLWAKYLPQSANPEDPYYSYTGEKFWIS
ncbi:MAG: TonB-dependent receptor plug domain-containing protein, partial [Fidelibacterota bacterium]